jgi:hypothetical protein
MKSEPTGELDRQNRVASYPSRSAFKDCNGIRANFAHPRIPEFDKEARTKMWNNKQSPIFH